MHILLATDGKPASLGAVRLAATLERDAGAAVRAVRVVQPLPLYAPASSPLLILPSVPMIDEITRDAESEARELLAEAGPGASEWPFSVEVGPPALTIVRAADEYSAALILLGLGRHERVDRWFGTETALRVAQLSHIPVLALPADGGWHRPGTVVVAVDFSTFSRDAFTTALKVAAPGAAVHLVFALDDDGSVGDASAPEDWRSHGETVRGALKEWAASVAEADGFRLAFHAPAGKPAEQILALAQDVSADLIAAGSYGAGFFGRTVLGSVSSRLLRGSDRAVLIAPPRDRARELAER